MSTTTTIFAQPPTKANYDVDEGSYMQFDTLVLRAAVALADSTSNAPQTLFLGGTSNVVVEAGGDFRVFTSNGVVEYCSSHFGASNARTDDMLLRVQETNSVDTLLSAGGRLILQGGDVSQSVTIGAFETLEDSNFQYLSTSKPSGFCVTDPMMYGATLTVQTDAVVAQNLTVGNDVDVGRNMMVRGDFFAQGLNIWHDKSNASTSNDTDQVGFSFRVTSDDQLELVRYSRFLSGNSNAQPVAVSQRLALFGGASNVTPESSSDTTPYNYSQLNNYLNVYPAFSNQGAGSNSVSIQSVWGTTATADLYYNGSGNVGIHTSHPTAPLDVVGAVHATSFASDSSISAASFLSTSDSRLKTVYGTVDNANCLQLICDLPLFHYSFLDDPAQRVRTGFIAQSVAALMPDAVYTAPYRELPDCKFIDSTVLLGYLAGSVKQLRADLQQETTIRQNLADQVNALRTRLEGLLLVMSQYQH